MNFDLKNPPDWTPPPDDGSDGHYPPKGPGQFGVETPKEPKKQVRLGVSHGSPAWRSLEIVSSMKTSLKPARITEKWSP